MRTNQRSVIPVEKFVFKANIYIHICLVHFNDVIHMLRVQSNFFPYQGRYFGVGASPSVGSDIACLFGTCSDNHPFLPYYITINLPSFQTRSQFARHKYNY